MTQKTAMQELKEWLVQMRNEAHIYCREEYKNAMNDAIVSVESLLEKERQQIIDAHSIGIKFIAGNTTLNQPASEIYYNQTYGGNK